MALMSSIDSSRLAHPTEVLEEIRVVSAQLSDIRFSDIVPRDLEAEAHAHEHLTDGEGDLPVELDKNGEVQDEDAVEKRKMAQLEDMSASLCPMSGYYSCAHLHMVRLCHFSSQHWSMRLRGFTVPPWTPDVHDALSNPRPIHYGHHC